MLSERTLDDVLDQKSANSDDAYDEQFHSDATPAATLTKKKLNL